MVQKNKIKTQHHINQINAVLLLSVVILFLLNLYCGPVHLDFSDSEMLDSILYKLRLPRALVALFAGPVLAIIGLMLQNWMHNPLAAPYVLGIESACSLGMLLWTIIAHGLFGFHHPLGLQISHVFVSFLAACLCLFFYLSLLRLTGKVTFILIVGLLLGGLINGMSGLILSVMPIEKMKGLFLWGMGSFENVYGVDLFIFMLINIMLMTVFFLKRHTFNLFGLGEYYAKSLGVDLKKNLPIMLILMSLGIGTITAFCGPIAFISIITPHIAKKLIMRGSFKAAFIPVALLGAIFTLLAQVLTPIIFSGIPINATLSLLGMPILIWILISSRHELAA